MVVATQADVDRLVGCVTLPGLTIRTAAPLALAGLETLARVDGDLALGPSVAIEALSLPRLTAVTGTLTIDSNASLDGIVLPRLARAGAIVVEDNTALAALSLPAVTHIDGDLRVSRSPSLELVGLPALQRVAGRLVIVDARHLGLLDAPALAHAGSVTIEATALPPDAVAALVGLAR